LISNVYLIIFEVLLIRERGWRNIK